MVGEVGSDPDREEIEGEHVIVSRGGGLRVNLGCKTLKSCQSGKGERIWSIFSNCTLISNNKIISF